MFKNLKRQFRISDAEISELKEKHIDIIELFQDYEDLVSDKNKYMADGEMQAIYKTLIKELEEEIFLTLSIYEAQNTS